MPGARGALASQFREYCEAEGSGEGKEMGKREVI